MRRQCTIHAFLVVVLLSTWDVQIVNGQGNSYLGLWGHVFDGSGSTKKNGTPTGHPSFSPPPLVAGLADRLHQAAGEWRAEADEVRSRLIQRIGGGGNAAVSATGTAAIGDEKEAATSFLSESFNQLFGTTAEKDSETAVSTTETLGLLDRMQERLGLDGKLDARQLAALAAAQGLALASLRKHLAASQARQTAANGIVSADIPARITAGEGHDSGSMNPFYDSHLHSFSIGVPLPDSMVSHFDGDWCLRLQNFANAPGYRSVYLGGVPFTTSSSTVTAAMPKASPPPFLQSTLAGTAAAAAAPTTAVLQWNSEAAFSLDCSHKTPDIPANTVENVEKDESDGFYSGVSAMFHHASSELAAALQPKTMECTVAISASGGSVEPSALQTQSSGSGTVLHSSQTIPLFTSHRLNAIKLRVCNLPVQSPAIGSIPSGNTASTSSGKGPSINVHGIKVNNRHLAIESLQQYPSNDCHVALLRLPTRAMADGFVLNGYLTLEKGNTGGSTGVFNVGEMASVEMQIGSLRLLSNSFNGVEGGAVEEEESELSPPPPSSSPLKV